MLFKICMVLIMTNGFSRCVRCSELSLWFMRVFTWIMIFMTCHDLSTCAVFSDIDTCSWLYFFQYMHILQSPLKFRILIIKIRKDSLFKCLALNAVVITAYLFKAVSVQSKTTPPQKLFPSDFITLYSIYAKADKYTITLFYNSFNIKLA